MTVIIFLAGNVRAQFSVEAGDKFGSSNKCRVRNGAIEMHETTFGGGRRPDR